MAKQVRRSRAARHPETAGPSSDPVRAEQPEVPVADPAVAAVPIVVADAPEGEWVQEVESSYLQSKYTWVSVAAKRARELLEGSKPRVESLSDKPVTLALEELAQGKLYFERVPEGRR